MEVFIFGMLGVLTGSVIVVGTLLLVNNHYRKQSKRQADELLNEFKEIYARKQHFENNGRFN